MAEVSSLPAEVSISQSTAETSKSKSSVAGVEMSDIPVVDFSGVNVQYVEEEGEYEEDEVRIKEETKWEFVTDIKLEANRVAKGLILKEQDFNSPAPTSGYENVEFIGLVEQKCPARVFLPICVSISQAVSQPVHQLVS